MADQTEPKGRYPRQEVAEGQEHGYIGEIEVYDPPENAAGYSNAEAPAQPKGTSKSNKTAADSAPAEVPIVGAAGLIGGTVDHVSAPKAAK